MLETLDKWMASLWSAILDFFIYLVSLLPAPESTQDIVATAQAIGEYAAYPAYLAGLDYAIPAFATSYLARFIIRRLPFIG